MQNETLELIPVEKVVENEFLMELEKSEIRKDLLIEKKNECLSLTIKGQDDKEGYTRLRETRLNQKATRIIIEKVCKAGRDKVAVETKKWLSLEKEWVAIVSEGEDYLKKIEDEYDAEKEKIAAEKKRKHDAQFTERSTLLGSYGAKLEEGYFVLGDIKYEASSIREVDAEIWEENIKPKYKLIFDEAETLRVENEQKLARMEQMRTTIFNTRFGQLKEVIIEGNYIVDEFDNRNMFTKDELADMDEVDFVYIKDEHNKVVNKRIYEREERKKITLRTENREKSLYDLGFTFDGTAFVHDTVTMFVSTVDNADDDKYTKLLEIATRQIEVIKEEAKHKQEESRKKAQVEADKLALGTSRLKTLADYEETGYTGIALSEMEAAVWQGILMAARTQFNDAAQLKLKEKQALEKQQAELRQAEELAKASDKEKWQSLVTELGKIEFPQARSGQYRKLIAIAKEKIEEIVNLKP